MARPDSAQFTRNLRAASGDRARAYAATKRQEEASRAALRQQARKVATRPKAGPSLITRILGRLRQAPVAAPAPSTLRTVLPPSAVIPEMSPTSAALYFQLASAGAEQRAAVLAEAARQEARAAERRELDAKMADLLFGPVDESATLMPLRTPPRAGMRLR